MLEYVIPSVQKGPLNKTWTNLGHRNIIKGVYQYANQHFFVEKKIKLKTGYQLAKYQIWCKDV